MLFCRRWMVAAIWGLGLVLIWTPTYAMSPEHGKPLGSTKAQALEKPQWMDRWGIDFGFAVEIETTYFDDSRETDTHKSVSEATAEVGVDVHPVKHVSGHVLLMFEENGDADLVKVDEAYVRLDGEEKMPFFIVAGRQYLPFGHFNSCFISDPLTLELGEARESSLVGGYVNEGLEISLGVFNGEVQKTGQTNNSIDGYVAGLVFTPRTSSGLGLSTGLSFISNIGESDGLQSDAGIDVNDGGTVADHVPGLGVFFSAQVKETLVFELEVVAAVEKFQPDELAFDNGEAMQPLAYNAELSYQINDLWVAGVRVTGSQDGGDYLPEVQLGAVVTCNLFEVLSMGLEYQYSKFDTPEDKKMTTVTAQLGVTF